MAFYFGPSPTRDVTSWFALRPGWKRHPAASEGNVRWREEYSGQPVKPPKPSTFSAFDRLRLTMQIASRSHTSQRFSSQ